MQFSDNSLNVYAEVNLKCFLGLLIKDFCSFLIFCSLYSYILGYCTFLFCTQKDLVNEVWGDNQVSEM